ncbi:MAG: FHA domain-containing protein [Pseudomonadota bacterium]
MAKLRVMSGAMEGYSFELSKECTLIGRTTENDIQIKDPSVSRKHLKITIKDDSFFIEDMGSHNGTLIKGKALKPGSASEVPEDVPIAMGKVIISLSRASTEGGLTSQYSIDLSKQIRDGEKNLLYKDRRITKRGELELIHEISTTLMQSLDINEIYVKIMDSLLFHLERLDSGVILLLNDDTGDLEEVIGRSRSKGKRLKINYSRTIVSRVISEGHAVMMSDTSREKKDDLSESIARMRIKSIMCVPLICKSKIRGVIYVHSVDVPQGFRKNDLFLLTALSSPAALAVENALLYKKRGDAEQALQKAHYELEKRVEDRTLKLQKTNELLKIEIENRKKAELKLKGTHEELLEANKNLGKAYAQMRDWKDHLSLQLHEEESGFLIDENGKITGITDKTLELTGKARMELLGCDIVDLVDQGYQGALRSGIRSTRSGLFHQIPVKMSGRLSDQKEITMKLMHIGTDKGKMIIVFVRSWEKEMRAPIEEKS